MLRGPPRAFLIHSAALPQSHLIACANGDPRSILESFSEGHGFSRAVKAAKNWALAAEGSRSFRSLVHYEIASSACAELLQLFHRNRRTLPAPSGHCAAAFYTGL